MTLPLMAKIDIKLYLDSLKKNETVYFCPNPGNAGDSLLAHATYELFDEYDIKYQILKEQGFNPNDKILLYGGGGNLVPYYSHARNFILKYHRLVKKLIILPHSIDGNEDLLKELDENVDIITREEVTYNHVKKNSLMANVFLADDLGFSLNVEKILSKMPRFSLHLVNLKLPVKILLQSNYTEIKHRARKLFQNKKKHVLNCFRTDQEKSDIDIPSDNIDLSSIFSYGVDSKEKAFYVCYRLLNFINSYEEIRTNRLHVAIAGALLGKEVKLYSNSYYKCEAVYEFSIQGRFPNVTWMG
jgi:exopolysaccharide biosynthesis predicted pyruvyltransferase EpsI